MAKTSSFVSKHGGQSEIVLRVKQGGNPTFGFLMPDHHLHPYFRFLVEHQELLTEKSRVEDKKNESGNDGGALSLLGSVYGTVEDEDAKEESAGDSKNESGEGNDGVKAADSSGPEGSKGGKKIGYNHSLASNGQASSVKKNPSVSAVSVVERKQVNTENGVRDKLSTSDKLQSSATLAQPKHELQILEPPTEMKRVIEKIVDFIQKNGKELEATLAAQDVKYGMFPFLRPASLYHAYYRKVLQEAEELQSHDKGDIIKKKDVKPEKVGNGIKDDKPASGSVLPDDSVKKEKLKMVSDKPKTESHSEPFKPVQPQIRVNVDANTAAAILQAARRGIRNPQLGILSGKPTDEDSQSLGSDRNYPSSKSFDTANSSGQLISGSAAASEADSSEARLSKEQKLKAERLKRAKMFVAMLKPGAQPRQQAEPSRSLSVEPSDSGISGSGANAAKDRENSSIPFEPETKQADDVNNDRRAKRNYRSRSQRDEKMEEGGEEEESSMDEEATEETKTDKKHSSSRKRHDRHRRKARYSSKERHYRDKQKHESSSDDEYHSRSRHRHKHRRSSDRHELYDSSDSEHEHRHKSSKRYKDADYSRDKRSHHLKSRKHDSSDDEHHHHHHRHRSSRRKHEDSSDSEHGHRHKSSKRMKEEQKPVEDETVSRSDGFEVKACPGDNPQSEPTQVSDELRAKIRAMLAETL